MIDLTAGPCICGTAADAVLCALEDGVTADKLTLSTDAHGSFPRFDDKGEMIGLDVCPINGAWPEFQKLVEKLGFEKAIGFVSTNLAKGLNLAGKGQIKAGMDADLLLVNDACEITDMFARGRSMMRAGTVVAKGMYEK